MPLPAGSSDTTALITGASSGIGVDLARELSARGHHVTLVARREDRLRALAEELGNAEVLACDLEDPEARDALPGRVAALGREVTVLVNNAGFGSGGRFEELDPASEARMVRLNCEAVVALTGAYAPGMVEAGRGAILVVASSAGMQPLPRQATYGASKAFALSFSEALHAELGPKGISVTALCPGPVKTEFWDVADLESLQDEAPGIAWVSSKDCARQAIDGLDHDRRVVVPGLAMRAATLAGRYTPRSVLLPIMRRFYPV